MANSTPQFMIRLCQPYGEIAYINDLIIINTPLSDILWLLVRFLIWQNTAGIQMTQVMGPGIFLPTVRNDDDDDDVVVVIIVLMFKASVYAI